jgi:hypothetical protein
MGRLGGLARAKKMSKKQMSDAMKKAVNARWKKYRENKKTTKNEVV